MLTRNVIFISVNNLYLGISMHGAASLSTKCEFTS